jgi:protein-S-isoprenylcysteine O-methyltransferase Ste14
VTVPGFLISALWLVWLVAWLLAARRTATTVVRQSRSARVSHSLPIWIGAALLFLHPRRVEILQQPLLPQRAWFVWIGVAVVAIGLGFAGWARVHLGRFWSGMVTIKAEHTLIRTGPYALTRHPIYTGLLVALAGTALARNTVGALLGFFLFLVGFMLKIRQEERLLLEHFGGVYRAYQDEVPALVPRFR